jgi:hypothetical protein
VDPNTDGNFWQLLAAKFGIELMEAVMKLKGGPDRTLCIVFVGSRIPEIDQYSVAAELGDKAAIAFHYRQGETLVLQLQIPQILGIQLLRQLGIAHKVAKKDRKVATLRDS